MTEVSVTPLRKTWYEATGVPREVALKHLPMARVKDCHLGILLLGFRLGHVPRGRSGASRRWNAWLNRHEPGVGFQS